MALFSQQKFAQPANKGDLVVQFKHSDAQRIADVVHAYETHRKDRKPSTLPRAVAGGGGGGVVEARYYGAWVKGSIKSVSLADDTTGTTLATCINLLGSIQPYNNTESTSRYCLIVSANTAAEYTLVNAEA